MPSDAEAFAFLASDPPHTGKSPTVRVDGSPHVAPIVVDGVSLVFTTNEDTLKGRAIRRDPRVALCVDDERPPFSFVTVNGMVEVSEDPDELLRWATALGGRYMGVDGRRSTALATVSPASCCVACAPPGSSRSDEWTIERTFANLRDMSFIVALADASSVPRRDAAARAHLAAVGAARAPMVLARDRALIVHGPLADAVPSVQRGTVIAAGGETGSGLTSAVLDIAAAATAAGEWAAMVDDAGTLGGLAAAEAGVDLARFAVVRSVPRDRWATVVAALLDGVSVVLAEIPRSVRVGDARRLAARARERSAVLVAFAPDVRAWPVEAAMRLQTQGGAWTGIGEGEGVLAGRSPVVEVTTRGRSTTVPIRASLELAG